MPNQPESRPLRGYLPKAVRIQVAGTKGLSVGTIDRVVDALMSEGLVGLKNNQYTTSPGVTFEALADRIAALTARPLHHACPDCGQVHRIKA